MIPDRETNRPGRWAARRGGWAVLWAVGILGLIVIVKPSEPFKGCMHANKNASEYQGLHERNAAPTAMVMRFYLRSRLVGGCAANFADKNERTIGALAAIALAVFTLYLWRATQGLRRYAGIQASDMHELLAAARNNATAAALQAAASEAQERALREQAEAMTAVAKAAEQSAEIARRALTELERPYIVVEVTEPGIQVDMAGQITFLGTQPRWEAINYGRSPAVLIDRITNWKVEADGTLPYAIDPTIAKGLPFPQGSLVDRDRPYLEIHNYMADLAGFDKMLDPDSWRKWRIWFYGYIRYGDILGGIYVNGFCLMFDYRGRQYVRIGLATHNYNATERQPGTYNTSAPPSPA